VELRVCFAKEVSMHRSRSPLLVLFTALVLSACGPDPAVVSPESASTASGALASTKPGKAPCHRWQACVPENPCHTGWVTGCRAGEPICTDIGGWLSNGTTCGDAAVCFMGECTPCPAGEACQLRDQWNNPLICRAGAIQCGTGQPVCTDVGPAADGTACYPGTGMPNVCDGGQCVWCWEGYSCTPPDAPCRVGAMSCSTGAHCLDTGATQPDGYYCGYQQVCSGGTCTYCESGMTCSLPEMPCWSAAVSCATGAPACTPQWPWYPGYPCGDGLACDGSGNCVPPCNQGASCFTGNLCEAGFMSCWSSTSGYCQPNGPLPDGTGCGDGMACQGGICQAACVPGAACTSPDPCRPGRPRR
jgi:hypothetical protein